MSKKLLLEKAQIEGIRSYEVYRREGGYRGVEKGLKMAPNDIVEEVKRSGLRGRGGAGYADTPAADRGPADPEYTLIP